jgi:adenine-specific DNA-methyltransferase
MYWRVSFDKFTEMDADKRIWWGRQKSNVPRIKRFLSEVMEGVVPQSIWMHDEVGNTQEAKKEVMAVVPNDAEVFQTPKPERLIKRVLELATEPGDLVLDSFAGSGTTGAVAHKMGRRWIMVELGEHCHTHIIPRLKKVIDGEDKGGITESVGWKGGGGFRYYRLGPSLIVEDEWGNPVINPEFNATMLAEAMCKLEGFTFEPNTEVYWQHGRSSEADFIYVTTQMMTREMLTKISDDVGPNRSLLICCGAFSCDVSQFENLTIRKIPKAVLKKCEWGHDDYSLEIKNLPAPPEEALSPESNVLPDDASQSQFRKPARKFGKARDNGPTLFDLEGTKNG